MLTGHVFFEIWLTIKLIFDNKFTETTTKNSVGYLWSVHEYNKPVINSDNNISRPDTRLPRGTTLNYVLHYQMEAMVLTKINKFGLLFFPISIAYLWKFIKVVQKVCMYILLNIIILLCVCLFKFCVSEIACVCMLPKRNVFLSADSNLLARN